MRLEVISKLPESDAHPTPVLFVHGLWTGTWPGGAFYGLFRALRLCGLCPQPARAWRVRGERAPAPHPLAEYVEDVAQVAATFPAAGSGGTRTGERWYRIPGDHAARPGADGFRANFEHAATVLRTFMRHPLPFLKAKPDLQPV